MELIALIILISSLLGIGMVFFQKIPVLVDLPIPEKGVNEVSPFLKLKNKIKNFSPFESFSAEIFLQKLLSKIRILTLKTDNKTTNWLQRLRERAQKSKEVKEDNYWGEIKKIKNKK